jgi:hypothetical protein
MEPLIAGASWTERPRAFRGFSGEYRPDGRDFEGISWTDGSGQTTCPN